MPNTSVKSSIQKVWLSPFSYPLPPIFGQGQRQLFVVVSLYSCYLSLLWRQRYYFFVENLAYFSKKVYLCCEPVENFHWFNLLRYKVH